MLLSWLGAILAYSPECLSEVPAGDRGILPSPIRLPPVKQALRSRLAGLWLRFPCIGWSWPHGGQGLRSRERPASRALEGPCAFKWLQHTRAALRGLARGIQEEGMAQPGMHAQVLCHRNTNLVSQYIRLQRQEGFFLEKELELLRRPHLLSQ